MELWQIGELDIATHHPEVLYSADGACRVVGIELPKGEQLQEHQVHEHALVFVVSGQLAVSADGREEVLSAPALAHFAPAERHEVRSVEDCRVVLCLAPWPGPGHPNLMAATR